MSLAAVLRAATPRTHGSLSAHHWKVLNAVMACRTPQLGGHRYRCEHCGREHFVPRSCGNRHCPTCQRHQALEWLARQEALLLPVPYFHVVFTLPHALNPLIQQNRRALYGLLFTAAAQTLLDFGRHNLGAQLGLTLVLHTWSQTLLDHYHVHCVVTGGGWALDGSGWRGTGEAFLFPVVALGRVFRGKYGAGLKALYGQGRLEFHGQLAPLRQPAAFAGLLRQATAKSWNVYAKRPFAGPQCVLRYLSRYTHRVAITAGRLRRLDGKNGRVSFAYQVRHGPAPPRWSTMELDLAEFLRRFCLHVLPAGLVKIRHYGLLANRGRQQRVAQVQAWFQGKPPTEAAPVQAQELARSSSAGAREPARGLCPYCGQRALVWIGRVLGARAPPPVARSAA